MGAHRGAEDGLRAEALGEDVAPVVPAGVQAQAPHRHHVHLLAAAALDAACAGQAPLATFSAAVSAIGVRRHQASGECAWDCARC